MLAVLQHRGIPMRLLDVTASPMTALWFATEPHRPEPDGKVRRTASVLFAIDVTKTDWYEAFQHGEAQSWDHLTNSLGATYEHALNKPAETGQRQMFKILPAVPDERMKAQEGSS